mmetsp:Transcript_29364/g.47405  ORF Transcript_29364/g.47405 Transcript_29364/m.47405 type:complete len:909 (+) Transcript_29364:124-2850(+)
MSSKNDRLLFIARSSIALLVLSSFFRFVSGTAFVNKSAGSFAWNSTGDLDTAITIQPTETATGESVGLIHLVLYSVDSSAALSVYDGSSSTAPLLLSLTAQETPRAKDVQYVVYSNNSSNAISIQVTGTGAFQARYTGYTVLMPEANIVRNISSSAMQLYAIRAVPGGLQPNGLLIQANFLDGTEGTFKGSYCIVLARIGAPPVLNKDHNTGDWDFMDRWNFDRLQGYQYIQVPSANITDGVPVFVAIFNYAAFYYPDSSLVWAKYSIVAYTGGTMPCPNNCSGRGACVNGVCTCDQYFIDTECSTVATPLSVSGGLPYPNRVDAQVVGAGSWHYYYIDVNTSTTPINMLIELFRASVPGDDNTDSAVGKGNPVLCLKPAGANSETELPSIYDIAANKWCDVESAASALNVHRRRARASSPSSSSSSSQRWYIGVLNSRTMLNSPSGTYRRSMSLWQEPTNFSLVLSSAAASSLPCPKGCALCDATVGQCKCPATCERRFSDPNDLYGCAPAGDICETILVTPRTFTSPFVVILDAGEYLYVAVNATQDMPFLGVKVVPSQVGGDGSFVAVRGSLPRVNYRYGTNVTYQYFGSSTRPMLLQLASDATGVEVAGMWYLMFFNSDYLDQFQPHARIRYQVEVVGLCLNGGAWSSGIRECVCVDGWSGIWCDDPSVKMSSSAIVLSIIVVSVLTAFLMCLCAFVWWRIRKQRERVRAIEISMASIQGGSGVQIQNAAAPPDGLSRTTIYLFPSYPFKEGSIPKDSAVCSVCLGEYTDGEDVRMLPCCHLYHKSCIDTWLAHHVTCPLCKRDLTQFRPVELTSQAQAPTPMASSDRLDASPQHHHQHQHHHQSDGAGAGASEGIGSSNSGGPLSPAALPGSTGDRNLRYQYPQANESQWNLHSPGSNIPGAA